MSIEMIALQRQRYNGVWIKEGETFSVDTQDEVDEMEGIRPPLARRNNARKEDYESRTMQAREQAQAAPQVAVSTQQKGKYERRDLRAR